MGWITDSRRQLASHRAVVISGLAISFRKFVAIFLGAAERCVSVWRVERVATRHYSPAKQLHERYFMTAESRCGETRVLEKLLRTKSGEARSFEIWRLGAERKQRRRTTIRAEQPLLKLGNVIQDSRVSSLAAGRKNGLWGNSIRLSKA